MKQPNLGKDNTNKRLLVTVERISYVYLVAKIVVNTNSSYISSNGVTTVKMYASYAKLFTNEYKMLDIMYFCSLSVEVKSP